MSEDHWRTSTAADLVAKVGQLDLLDERSITPTAGKTHANGGPSKGVQPVDRGTEGQQLKDADPALDGTRSEESDNGDTLRTTGIPSLVKQVNGLLNHIYELQELRHMRHASASASSLADEQLATRLSDMAAEVAHVQRSFDSLEGSELDSAEASGPWSDLQADWIRTQDQYGALREEMKEDGWLLRFRDTANQAEAMLNSLRQSWQSCSTYVDQILSSPSQVPFDSDLNHQLNFRRLQELTKSHEAMRVTYMPSIVKTLKLMDRSIHDRPAKNGEALRRYNDMAVRWQALQKDLRELEARIRLIMNHRSPSGSFSAGSDYDDLMAEKAPFAASSLDSDGSYNPLDAEQSPTLPSSDSHRSSSWSSNVSSRSKRQSLLPPSQPAASDRGSIPASLNRLSILPGPSTGYGSPSARSVSAATAVGSADPMRTPTARRFASQGQSSRPGGVTGLGLPHAANYAALPSAPGSKIPTLSPTRTSAPSHTASGDRLRRTSNASSFAPSNRPHMPPSRELFQSPVSASRPRISSAFSPTGLPNTPSARPIGMGVNPHIGSSSRQSLARPPPSSYRGVTPTPSSFRSPTSRPSSRMSVGSRAASIIAPASLTPFSPSKYDLLDQHVSRIIAEEGFNLFVSRIDQSLQKTQRKRDDEEWKGEFVFGAGQKKSNVKLLKLAGRPTQGEQGPRVKVMARAGGQWVDLSALLRQRLEDVESDEVF